MARPSLVNQPLLMQREGVSIKGGMGNVEMMLKYKVLTCSHIAHTCTRIRTRMEG